MAGLTLRFMLMTLLVVKCGLCASPVQDAGPKEYSFLERGETVSRVYSEESGATAVTLARIYYDATAVAKDRAAIERWTATGEICTRELLVLGRNQSNSVFVLNAISGKLEEWNGVTWRAIPFVDPGSDLPPNFRMGRKSLRREKINDTFFLTVSGGMIAVSAKGAEHATFLTEAEKRKGWSANLSYAIGSCSWDGGLMFCVDGCRAGGKRQFRPLLYKDGTWASPASLCGIPSERVIDVRSCGPYRLILTDDWMLHVFREDGGELVTHPALGEREDPIGRAQYSFLFDTPRGPVYGVMPDQAKQLQVLRLERRHGLFSPIQGFPDGVQDAQGMTDAAGRTWILAESKGYRRDVFVLKDERLEHVDFLSPLLSLRIMGPLPDGRMLVANSWFPIPLRYPLDKNRRPELALQDARITLAHSAYGIDQRGNLHGYFQGTPYTYARFIEGRWQESSIDLPKQPRFPLFLSGPDLIDVPWYGKAMVIEDGQVTRPDFDTLVETRSKWLKGNFPRGAGRGRLRMDSEGYIIDAGQERRYFDGDKWHRFPRRIRRAFNGEWNFGVSWAGGKYMGMILKGDLVGVLERRAGNSPYRHHELAPHNLRGVGAHGLMVGKDGWLFVKRTGQGDGEIPGLMLRIVGGEPADSLVASYSNGDVLLWHQARCIMSRVSWHDDKVRRKSIDLFNHGIRPEHVRSVVMDPWQTPWLIGHGGLTRVLCPNWDREDLVTMQRYSMLLPTAHGAFFDKAGNLWLRCGGGPALVRLPRLARER
jgi:hypothetical protein